ncbi:MAG: hypothetical protein IKI73_05075 [Firmicutes bacterium]|nr:hypothetical protein [Bacillota bacterium]MBR6236336.1 hypothetical protein [Bacillota bacterium]
MEFSNALNGIKKLRTAEILSLIVALLGAVGGGLVLGAVKSTSSVENAVNAGGSAIIGGGLIAVIAGILAIVAFILQLVGLNAAGKDETRFRQGFIIAIVGIVVSLLQTVFAKNALLSGVFEVISSVISPVITYLCIDGIINIAKKLGNDEMAERGTKLFKIIIAIYAIVIVIKLLETIFSSGAVVKAISGVFAIIAGVLSIVALVTYLKYLGRAVKMLER